jgi:hypothetical protein
MLNLGEWGVEVGRRDWGSWGEKRRKNFGDDETYFLYTILQVY